MRSILRISTSEFAVQKSTPVKGTINAAVELTQRAGSDSAPRFANRVLGSQAEHQDEIAQSLQPVK